uniref:Uncharacterized protein n=1 Tax=uncultured Armatimonadetes bacterium TaxID=157466 RepID=A0A6J4HCC8_9BACT|nr:hypothetical protein AVDCRST_MAG63-472 [uncultured Armatimonadetes bacterium]
MYSNTAAPVLTPPAAIGRAAHAHGGGGRNRAARRRSMGNSHGV